MDFRTRNSPTKKLHTLLIRAVTPSMTTPYTICFSNALYTASPTSATHLSTPGRPHARRPARSKRTRPGKWWSSDWEPAPPPRMARAVQGQRSTATGQQGSESHTGTVSIFIYLYLFHVVLAFRVFSPYVILWLMSVSSIWLSWSLPSLSLMALSLPSVPSLYTSTHTTLSHNKTFVLSITPLYSCFTVLIVFPPYFKLNLVL